MAGKVLGVGGTKLAQMSRSIVQIEGMDGRLASLCPFIVDCLYTLLGKDTMSH